MADEDREINARVVWTQTGADAVSQTASQMTNNWKSYNQELKTTEQSYHSLRMAGRELGQISREVLVAGALLTGALVLDANNYIKAVGTTTAIGAAWVENTNKIKNANLEIGQTAATVMLPAYQKLGDIIQIIANIVQANPWMVATALTVGGVLTAVGTLGMIVSSVIRVVADAGLLIDKITNAGVLGGQAAQVAALSANTTALVANTAAVSGASLTGGIGAGEGAMMMANKTVPAAGISGIGEVGLIGAAIVAAIASSAYANTELNKLSDTIDSVAKKGSAASTVFAGFRGLIDTLMPIEGILHNIGLVMGDITKAGATGDNGAAKDALMNQALPQFEAFQQQMTAAEQTYDAQRLNIVQSTEQQMADATATYESQRAGIIESTEQNILNITRNFEQQQAQSAQSYNEQIAKDQRNYQQQEAAAAAAHALQMQQLAQAHADNVWSLASARDALGLVKEDEHYKQQVDNANAQYRLQQQQAAQAYANQLADAAQAYADQQAAAQQAYQDQLAAAQAQEAQQLTQLDAAHALEMAKLQQQEADKLKQLDDAYKKQTDDLKKNFLDVMQKEFAAAGVYMLQSQAAVNAAAEQELADLKAWIAANEASTGGIGAGGTGGTGAPGMGSQSIIGPGMISSALSNRAGAMGYGGGNLNMTVNGRSLTLREVRFEIDNALDAKLSDLIPAFGA
jgi:hypothetical protein